MSKAGSHMMTSRNGFFFMRNRTGCSANIAESMTRTGSGPPVEWMTSGNNNELKSIVLICFMNTQFMPQNSTECSIYQSRPNMSRPPGQVKLSIGQVDLIIYFFFKF